MKAPKRPVGLMTLAQGICLAAIPLTLLFLPFASIPNFGIIWHLQLTDSTPWLSLLRDFVLGILFIQIEIEAFSICGRLKKASAFSTKNEKALGRIAAALGIAGGVSLLFGDAIIPWLLTGLPAISPIVERLLLPFILLALALMIRTVQVLMHRALTMQEESDLTV